MKTKKPLSAHQKKVLAAFENKDQDISISRIYMLVYGHDEWQKKGTTVRIMQQKLAPTFSEINKKLIKARIEPGDIKRTYKLNTSGE